MKPWKKMKRTKRLIDIKEKEMEILKRNPTLKGLGEPGREELIGKDIFKVTKMGITTHTVDRFTPKKVVTKGGLMFMQTDCFKTREGAEMRLLFSNMAFLEQNGLGIGYADVLAHLRDDYAEYWI